ncbi:aminotransferase class III-fold pyridoxal phosphate-dependent enzyme [Amycolatopsis camponoti]|nr:aminotransferase class III-fold pyridoxal phosphate-dependent enzyme [Amycolatopsis camponoti]
MCDRHGAVLVFDEVIAGFRIARGGAAEKYGVRPDLSVFGKAMAGGFTQSAVVAGRIWLIR